MTHNPNISQLNQLKIPVLFRTKVVVCYKSRTTAVVGGRRRMGLIQCHTLVHPHKDQGNALGLRFVSSTASQLPE